MEGVLTAILSKDGAKKAQENGPRTRQEQNPSGIIGWVDAPRRILQALGGFMEAFGGVLEAVESVLEALGGALEAMVSQDGPKIEKSFKNKKKNKKKKINDLGRWRCAPGGGGDSPVGPA